MGFFYDDHIHEEYDEDDSDFYQESVSQEEIEELEERFGSCPRFKCCMGCNACLMLND